MSCLDPKSIANPFNNSCGLKANYFHKAVIGNVLSLVPFCQLLVATFELLIAIYFAFGL